MGKKTAAKKPSSDRAVPLTGRSVAVVSGFALVRVEPKKRAVAVPRKDTAAVLVQKVGGALNKPGVDKRVVFKDQRTGVFSYSAYPGDPTKVVRESADGSKRVGRLVKGRFVAAKTTS